MRTGLRFQLLAAIASVAVLALAGCYKTIAPPVSGATSANSKACGGTGCHDSQVVAQSASSHEPLDCASCHPDSGEPHRKSPKTTIAGTDWRIDSCKPCHADVVLTYLYDDNAKPGPFGGSTIDPPQPKRDTFPGYDTIVAGHAFAKDYNEEGAHSLMLSEHMKTTRGKFETCVQCKSTKLDLAWNSGKPLRVSADTTVTLTHTKTDTTPAKQVLIPKGTTLTYATDKSTRRVDSKMKLPDGTAYSSQPKPSEDATQNYNMVWAGTIAAISETVPYGAGCNHCHDPHTGKTRYVRKAMVESIGRTGVNPYAKDSPKKIEDASAQDRRILTCSQCHVEYTCGKSGVDGIDRDAFGWTKAGGLHDLYTKQFDYSQDWKQKLIGQPLIKSQHPETELYWNSTHYIAGASCGDCHMPEITGSDGGTFRSHWFTSPYKYSDPKLKAMFEKATGVTVAVDDNPCRRCHGDRTVLGQNQQRAFYERQKAVQALLVQSVGELARVKAVKDAGGKVDQAAYTDAIAAHRKAHVLWENLAVSENSMGFHNFSECMGSMDTAEKDARSAIERAQAATR